MIIHNVEQGSAEWRALRAGLATASAFGKIVTPAKGELSKSASDYANELISELITGEPQDGFFKSYWMERGALMEVEAKHLYEFETGYKIENCGIITSDDMKIGASPDVLVYRDGVMVGGAEIKCPSPKVHVENLLRDGIDPKYKPQIQGQIMISNFEFVDWFSYHPDMPPSRITVERDDEYIGKMKDALDEFLYMVEARIKKLKDKGVLITWPKEYVPDTDEENLTRFLEAC